MMLLLKNELILTKTGLKYRFPLFLSRHIYSNSIFSWDNYALDKPIIPALPDLIPYPRNSSAVYLILACDGTWDVMNNEQVCF